MLGEMLERYQVQELLGEGAASTVYKVVHQSLGSTHALKVLQVGSDIARERFLREGRAQAGVRHTNLVAVTDVIEVAGRPALLLEYVDGPTLEEWLGCNRPTLSQALELFRGIVRGVDAIHRAGFVHRDLKPANVLLATAETELVPKVADFGLVKELGGGATSSIGGEPERPDAVGTVGYMAPEQVRGAPDVDERADLFALGCILYELVTGHRPFEGSNVVDVARCVREGRAIPAEVRVPGLSPVVATVLRTLLAVDRSARFRSCDELLEQLYEPRPRLPLRQSDERPSPVRTPDPPSGRGNRYPHTPEPSSAPSVKIGTWRRSAPVGLLAAVAMVGFGGVIGYVGVWLEPAAKAQQHGLPSPVFSQGVLSVAAADRVPSPAPVAATPAEVPLPAEVHPARAPRPVGTVRVEGDGEIVLTDPSGRPVDPGVLDAGIWQYAVRFGSTDGPGGTFALEDGQVTTLRCSSFAMRCIVTR